MSIFRPKPASNRRVQPLCNCCLHERPFETCCVHVEPFFALQYADVPPHDAFRRVYVVYLSVPSLLFGPCWHCCSSFLPSHLACMFVRVGSGGSLSFAVTELFASWIRIATTITAAVSQSAEEKEVRYDGCRRRRRDLLRM